MKKASILIIVFSMLFGACSNREPKILIIGDSISIGYTPYVIEHFSDKAIIAHNVGNAQHTGTGKANIRKWVGDGNWDIIQFNFGLWDLCYRHPDSKTQGNRDKVKGTIAYNIDDYMANLDTIATSLKKLTKAKLIFVTTTYVPKNEAGRFEDDARRYNDAAKMIMDKHSIPVNDIYEESIPIHYECGKGSDNVHYNKEGYERLSKLVIDFLEAEIKAL